MEDDKQAGITRIVGLGLKVKGSFKYLYRISFYCRN